MNLNDENECFLLQYVLDNFDIAKANIDNYSIINEWDLLVKKNDGTRILFDTFNNTFRTITYGYELSEEERLKEFGINLNKCIKRNFITKDMLLETLGIGRMTLYNYINGRRYPDAYMLKRMSEILHCSMEDFFCSDKLKKGGI